MTISTYVDVTDAQIIQSLHTLTPQQLLEVIAFLLVRDQPLRKDLVQKIVQLGQAG
jgi:hypothetical protein